MKASVVICTRNRAESLRETLAALAAVLVKDGLEAEIVVVDNGSSDQTREVVASVTLPNFSVRYGVEPREGQSHARNSGMAWSNGDIILFVDDDVRPAPGWLEAMCLPLLDKRSELVAGQVTLAEDRRRSWMSSLHLARLAHFEERKEQFAGVGANMGFLRSVLARVPRFDTALGPGALGFGDETLFFLQAARAGFRGAYADQRACAQHYCGLDRLSREAFVSDAIKSGRSQAYIDCHWVHAIVSRPLLKAVRAAAGLRYVTLRCRWTAAEGIHPAHWRQINRVAYFLQWRRESKQPRRYGEDTATTEGTQRGDFPKAADPLLRLLLGRTN